MKIAGLIFIVVGLIGFIFEKHPTEEKCKINATLDEVKKSQSVRLFVLNNRKVNFGLIVVGLILVIASFRAPNKYLLEQVSGGDGGQRR